MATFTVTCHTADCANAGHAINLAYDPDGPPYDGVVCGVCGQPITDVTGLPATLGALFVDPDGDPYPDQSREGDNDAH